MSHEYANPCCFGCARGTGCEREDRKKWTGACTWCAANFRTRAELAEHMREEHGEDTGQ